MPGAPLPEIPAGAEIQVLTGEAVFQSGETVVQANAGDTFSFNAPAAGGQVSIATVGDKTEIKVVVGKSEASLGKGDSVSVTADPGKASQIAAVTGEVSVVSDGKTQNLTQGQTMASAPATPAIPATPACRAKTWPFRRPRPNRRSDSGRAHLHPRAHARGAAALRDSRPQGDLHRRIPVRAWR